MDETVSKILKYYCDLNAQKDQSVLISLLREVQQVCGGTIPVAVLPEIAAAIGAKESYLLAVIRRIPSLRLAECHILELCAGPNCGKSAQLAALAEKLCTEKNVKLRFVPCMRMCGRGPNLKYDGTCYHKADEALLRKLVR